MALAIPDAPLTAIPGLPDDDVPDTVVAPPGAYASLPSATLAEVQDAMRCLARVVDATFARLPPLLEQHAASLTHALTLRHDTLSAPEASALQHLCEALDGLKAGLVVSGAPYKLEMQALTPQGYPITLTIERQDGAAFFEAVTSMASWLASNAYTVPPAAVPF